MNVVILFIQQIQIYTLIDLAVDEFSTDQKPFETCQ